MNGPPNYLDCTTCGGNPGTLCGTCQARAREKQDEALKTRIILCVMCDRSGRLESGAECPTCDGTGWATITQPPHGETPTLDALDAANDDIVHELADALVFEGLRYHAGVVVKDGGVKMCACITTEGDFAQDGEYFQLTDAQTIHLYRILGAHIYGELDPALMLEPKES